MERIGLEPGTEIGGYTIIAPLGSGGMGTVYRVHDDQGLPAALKLLHPHLRSDPAARTRLIQEVGALQKLRHPAVVRVIDAEYDSSEPFIVTELILGQDLTEVVELEGPLTGRDLHEFAGQLRQGLAAVHQAGLVHRDIKPANVMMTSDGPVLIDFGIAKFDELALTATGMVIGTPGYLAPEILSGAHPTAATDWWSWAATLAFAVTGRVPFGGSNHIAVSEKIRRGEPDLEGLDPAVAERFRLALHPDPDERCTPDELLEVLDPGFAGAGAGVRTGADSATEVLPAASAEDGLDATRQLGGQTAGGLLVGDAVSQTAQMPLVGPEQEFAAQHGEDSADSVDVGLGGDGSQTADAPIAVQLYAKARPFMNFFAFLALGGLGGLVPGPTLLGWVGLAIILWAIGSAATALGQRRYQGLSAGPGRALLISPWHLLRSIVGSLPAVLVGVAVFIIAAGVAWWLLASGRLLLWPSAANSDLNAQWVLNLGFVVSILLAILLTFWGPFAKNLRTGSRHLWRVLAPNRAMSGLIVVLMLVVCAGAGLLMWQGWEILWWPLDSAPPILG